jgi:hypothetical protein
LLERVVSENKNLTCCKLVRRRKKGRGRRRREGEEKEKEDEDEEDEEKERRIPVEERTAVCLKPPPAISTIPSMPAILVGTGISSRESCPLKNN